ncbi:mitochondrial inner membrane translocase subunit TIM44 [Pleomassaria siparia CBS 279.74]|uniref:Mitochondrial import inner membrane translocase subunit TIM44 n=1 Tax=Pleomassaria siparia CBS 279.74 TaxID=1314801 RepID=A0A6G1JWL1_9PLEO|nr:mitochondrial inner membrane translocase subunit TIM44 [Pleomassaria siparia CBS 279.74]
MRTPTASTFIARARWATNQPFAATPSSIHGRAAAYRRISTTSLVSRSSNPQQRSNLSSNPQISPFSYLRSDFLPHDVLFRTFTAHARQFSHQVPLHQHSQKKAEDVVKEKDSEPEVNTKQSTSGESATGQKPTEETGKGEETGEKKAGEEDAGEQKGEKEGEDGKKKEAPPPPPPHGDKSPWQVFTETLKSEFQASKEWNESTKQLSAGVNDFNQNPNVQKVKNTYTQVAGAATTKTAEALKTTGKAIGQGAAWTWDTTPVKGVRKVANVTGSGIEYVTRPVRESKAFQAVKETVDDGSSSRYGGWTEKEERKRRRELRELNELRKAGGKTEGPMEEDPDAGTNVTLHKDARYKEIWREFKESSPLARGFFTMQSVYKESENPLISTARGISDRITGFFAENETAMVIKKFREMDPNFQLEPFLTEMREYILPEVLDAYVKGDVETLKLWLSAAQYSVYAALMAQYTTAGLKSDGRIVDIRNVDILNARLLEPGEIPVFIITCRTQEVHVYKNAKTGDLAAGMEDKVQQVTYAIGVTRIPEDVNNAETRGWRLIELQKSARDYI